MTLPSSIPLILKKPDWPEADKKAWDGLVHSGRFLEDEGAFSKWSESTKKINTERYGQWLSFLARKRPDDLLVAPTKRLMSEAISAYVIECNERLRTVTTAQLVLTLLKIGRALEPEGDWSHLARTSDLLFFRSDIGTLKPRVPIFAGEILSWSIKRMDDVQSAWAGTKLYQAVAFREALMVGALIACPVRVRSFMGMTLNRHLREVADQFEFHFDGHDMKDNRARSFIITRALTNPLRMYRDHFRPILLSDKRSDAFWITHHGKPMMRESFTGQLAATTETFFGLRLRPHSFRHIAATSIAELDPEHVRIIRDILGHANLEMAERHYNRASAISSCNALQSIVADIRRNALRMGNHNPSAVHWTEPEN